MKFRFTDYKNLITHHFTLIVSLVLVFVLGCREKQTAPTEVSDLTVTESSESAKNDAATKKIIFFGNSLTAGYGLDENEAFPNLIQKRLDSLNLLYTVVNAGLSGETTAGGLSRINWILNQDIDVFVLELGANDALRGLEVNNTKENLQGIMDQVWEKDPDIKIIIAGMKAPPNMGANYAQRFDRIFAELSEENEVPLIPFLLEDVAGIPELNLEDRKHPNTEGQKIVAENVWRVLEPLLSPSS